jgi:hypothetical protein
MSTEDEEGMNIIKHSSNDSSNDNTVLLWRKKYHFLLASASHPAHGKEDLCRTGIEMWKEELSYNNNTK